MKVIRQLLLMGFFLCGAMGGLSVLAQGTYEQFEEEIELTREIAELGREVIVEKNMELSQQESQKFWPVYNDYRATMAKVNDRRVKLITDYADSYRAGNLSDEKALRLLNDFLSIEKAKLKVKRRYVPRFRRVLPPKKVVRFFQVDNRLDTIVNVGMAKGIPLVR